MGRKKREIMAFETLCPDSLRKPSSVCKNFIVYGDCVEKMLHKEVRSEELKTDSVLKDFQSLLSFKTKYRDGLGNIGIDEVSLVPITLGSKVKGDTPYIYRILTYGETKTNPVYTTRKDAINDILRKVRVKSVFASYGGKNEEVELSEEMLNGIFDYIEKDTFDCAIVPLGRDGAKDLTILITIFKNDLQAA